MESTSFLDRVLEKVRTFDAIRHYRNFRFLLFSNLLYSVNMWMLMLVMGWLAYELTSSAFLVAAYGAARTAPFLLGPISGAIADRINRKKFIIGARVLQLLFASILAVLVTTGLVEYWHLVLIGFLQSVAGNAGMTGSSALSMDIVGKEHITNAIALNAIVMDVTRIVGPAVGGALVAITGPANCFWMAVGFAIIAIVILFPIRMPGQQMDTVRNTVTRDIIEGFRYVVSNRNTISILIVTVAANIFIWPANASFMPIFAKDNLGLDALGLGILLMASGAGALVGALFIASLGDFKWKGALFLYGTAIWSVFFGFFALSRVFPVALTLVTLAGLASSSFMTMQSTLMLILAPEEMRARCLGFVQMSIGVLPFASLGLGAISDAVGTSLATAVSCAILPVIMIILAITFPNLRRMR